MTRQNEAQLQRNCDAFNKQHPVGSPIAYSAIIGGPVTLTTTVRSPAYVMSGHSAVTFIEGKSGCVALDALATPEGGQA